MGRRSKYAEHKQAVRDRVLQGASLATLRLEFGSQSAIGVPESTLQDWYRRFRAEPGERPIFDFEQVNDPLRERFDKAEEMLWDLARTGGEGDGVKVQALNTLLRLLSDRNRLFPRSLNDLVELLIDMRIGPGDFKRALAQAQAARLNQPIPELPDGDRE